MAAKQVTEPRQGSGQTGPRGLPAKLQRPGAETLSTSLTVRGEVLFHTQKEQDTQ